MSRVRPALLLLVAAASTSHAQPPERVVEQVVRSSDLPRIEIAVDPSLSYLGKVSRLAMGGKAKFEQYVFSEVRAGQMRRTLLVHFEQILPGHDLVFEYPRMSMVTLGRHEYLHQSWPLEDWELFQSPEMQQLLAARAIEAPRAWLVDRYVRAVDAAKKAELILFYLEPAGALPAPIDQLGLGGRSRHLWEPLAGALATRARAVFTVRD